MHLRSEMLHGSGFYQAVGLTTDFSTLYTTWLYFQGIYHIQLPFAHLKKWDNCLLTFPMLYFIKQIFLNTHSAFKI